jgi:dienelactone hydrolase
MTSSPKPRRKGAIVADIALFHSVLGVRPGVLDAAERLRAAGHEVLTVDQYDGRVFDDYDEAAAFVETVGFPALMGRAAAAVEALPDGFISAGFSNGGGMAEFVALTRKVAGVIMLSGTLPLDMLEADAWPAGVPAQIHYTLDDPNRDQAWIDAVAKTVEAAGAPVWVYDYPGSGHLFTDPSLPKEYDAEASELVWRRVIGFCADPQGYTDAG